MYSRNFNDFLSDCQNNGQGLYSKQNIEYIRPNIIILCFSLIKLFASTLNINYLVLHVLWTPIQIKLFLYGHKVYTLLGEKYLGNVVGYKQNYT